MVLYGSYSQPESTMNAIIDLFMFAVYFWPEFFNMHFYSWAVHLYSIKLMPSVSQGLKTSNMS